jgi:hypothetical protein
METCPTGGLPLENSNGKPKYDGVTVYMDGKEWVVPALSVRQFRQHYQTLLDSDITPENYPVKMAERLSIVLAAMQRNYPEITEEQLLDMIDLRSFLTIWLAIQSASGLRPATPGESQPVPRSTGVGSTER